MAKILYTDEQGEGMRLITLALATTLLGCRYLMPAVEMYPPPCDCACSFRATAPEIGQGCWVSGDLLTCPLVRRELEVAPAFPSEDPRCTELELGGVMCEVYPVD